MPQGWSAGRKKFFVFLSAAGVWGTVGAGSGSAQNSGAFVYGYRYFQSGDFRSAAKYFEMAMRMNPGDDKSLFYDALSYQKLGETERARALYKHVLAVFPDSPSAKPAGTALRRLLLEQARSSGATPSSEHSAGTPPSLPARPPVDASKFSRGQIQAAFNKEMGSARAQREAGNFNEAENDFRDAMQWADKLGQLSPELADLLQEYGGFLVELKRTAPAFELGKRELSIRQYMYGRDSRNTIDCLMRVAPLYKDMKNLDTAQQYYERCQVFFQKQYDDAVQVHKRLVNERNELLNCLNCLLDILQTKRGPQQANQPDERVDALKAKIAMLQAEAAQPK